MGRSQIGSAWGYTNLGSGDFIPLPPRNISAGSLVVAGFRTESQDINLTVSDSVGGTWYVTGLYNTNTKVFFAYSWNHPGGTNVVITADLASSGQAYRFGSAAEFEGGDTTDPYISALTLKETDGSASLTTPANVDTFQVFGCYSSSTITPVSPAFSLNGEASNTLYGFSAINTIDGTTRDHNTSGGAGNIAAITAVFSRPGPSDTTAPTLTSATATATGANTATGGVTTNEAGPAWAVLTTSSTTPSAAQIKAGQDHAGAAASASATATLSVGSNPGVFSFTGLTGGQTYWEHVVQDDTATPANTSTPITSASSITTPTPDTTPPTMNGSITVGTKTSGSISISYPAASDNVAVTGYEVSTNGTTWSDNSTSLSYTFLGLAALTSYNLRVRAYDAAGNRAATPLAATTSTYRAGDTAANILANTGPVGGNPAGFLYAFASTVTSTDWLSYTIVSGPTPAGGTLDANPDGTFTYVGPDAATLVIQPEVNGANAAETITVTLYDQSPDAELPVLTGSITVTNLTSTSYDLSWPTGTDDTGVTGYEYSLNGGTSWADNGNVTTKSITGRTPESTDQVRVRAYDAAGNKSTPALATSVTLLAGPDVTAPLLSLPTAYASGPTTASGTITTNEATGTLYYLRNNSATATAPAVKAGLSQPVTAAGIQTVNVTGLTASTPGNYIHYLHQDGSGNDSLVSSSAAFTTPAAPAPGLKVIGAQPTKLIARPITRPIAIKQTD